MLTADVTKLAKLVQGYTLCARTEGKSGSTIEIVAYSVAYLDRFLRSQGLPTDPLGIGPNEIRAFVLHLQQKRCFSGHRLNKPQDRELSGHTVSCYLRSIRVFFSWLVSEGVIGANPFDRVRIPHPPKKVMPTFSDIELRQLLGAIDTSSAEGYRDYAIVITLLDTGLRVSELCRLKLGNAWLGDGMLKVIGKGNRERLIPIGKQVQRVLWRYVDTYRPEPATPVLDFLFLTRDGRPLTKDRVEKIIARYGKKAGLQGIRCSPHVFRHTAAVKFLRNGGDVFSLQRLLGHASLEMTRRYCELADMDVKKAHMTASPVDNLNLCKQRRAVGKRARG